MAVIYSYPKLSTLQDKDLLLISDVSSKNKPTNRVELGTIRTYINSFIDVGVVGSGTTDTVPIWTDSQELGDSPLVLVNDAPPVMQVNGSFQVFEPNSPIIRTSLKQLSGPGFRAQSPDIGAVDNRQGFVRVGGGSGKHALNLYTSSDFSDPTGQLDAAAFEYKFNDGYTFARIEAEDYSVNINPLWEVGDVFSENTSYAWRVNFGDYAEFSSKNLGVTAFKVTPTGVTTNVNVTVNGDIQTVGIDSSSTASLANGDYLFEVGGAEFSAELDMGGNQITRCGDPTLPKDAANKSYVDSSLPQLADNFPDDAAAALAGILVGGLYHTAGVVKIRVS